MALGVRMDQMRFQSHDIGGSFGIKITNYTYMGVAALASKKAGGRPIKWIETRSEHMTASAHGNERVFLDTRVALDKKGVITAIDSRIWAQVLPGVYRFRNYRADFSQVVSNKCPVGPNRGYSRMLQLWFLERVVDICAHTLGIPGDEMRLRNYIKPKEFPYTTPNGCIYDSGNYPKMLELAKKQIGWDQWKKKQKKARAEGRWLGIGIGSTLDSGTNNFGQSRIINPHAPFSGQSGAAIVKLDIDGNISAAVGSVPQGQGHETTTAQIVADILNVHPDMVRYHRHLRQPVRRHRPHRRARRHHGVEVADPAAGLLHPQYPGRQARARRRQDGPRGAGEGDRQVGDFLGAGQPGQCQHRGPPRQAAQPYPQLPQRLARALQAARHRAQVRQPDPGLCRPASHLRD
jgi:CO/xanthine dehydrogenase Mo-binding subunit